MPPPSSTPPRGASPARAPSTEAMPTEEEEENAGAGGFPSVPDFGGERVSPLGLARVGRSFSSSLCILLFLFSSLAFDLGSTPSPSWCPGPSSEDVDTTIKDIATEAAAEAEKIAAEESARGATEDAAREGARGTAEGAAKGPTEGPGKERAEEPGKGPAEGTSKATAEEVVVDDQPSSSTTSGSGKYLKVSEDLFVYLPGA